MRLTHKTIGFADGRDSIYIVYLNMIPEESRILPASTFIELPFCYFIVQKCSDCGNLKNRAFSI